MRLAATLAFFLAASATSARTWHIAPDGTGDAPTIQAGIDSCAAGDTVLVDVGDYHESIDFSGKDILVGSHFVVTADTAYITQTVVNGVGRVVSFTGGESRAARLSGLTITGGSAYEGAGIGCSGASPTLDHLRIVGNVAMFQGGGIYTLAGAPLVSNCRIVDNVANTYGGGGIACMSSGIVIDGNVIGGNQAAEFGGGIYTDSSSPVITNNYITGNTVSYAGCGIGSRDCTSIITDNHIVNNGGSDYGGGLFY